MTIDAIIMMGVSMLVIWGGLGWAVIRLARSPQEGNES